jgi:hypothetical protein
MMFVWLIYFSFAELSSLGPSKASSCILISEEANTENYSGDYPCAAMHEAIFRFVRYLWNNASHDNVIAFGTVLIAIFTYVLYRSTDKLWEAGERQLKHLERTAERQLRAYVYIVGKDFLIQGQEHERFVNQIRILNSGQTPAYKLRIQSVTRTLPYPLPAEFDFDATPKGRYPSVMMVGPGRELGHDSLADIILSPIEMANIMREDSDIRLYSYGTIQYDDCFDQPRFTNFCFFLGWNITTEGYTLFVHATEQHNDAN